MDVFEVVHRALERSDEPLTISKLQKQLTGPYRLPAEKLGELLEEHVCTGRLFRFAPYGSKASRYWHLDHASYARVEIKRSVEPAPLSIGALQKKVAKRLADCSASQRKSILEQLVREGRIRLLPPLPRGRTQRYSPQPPDPADYVRALVNEFVRRVGDQAQRLAAVDVDPAATWQAARGSLEAKLDEAAPASTVSPPPTEEGSAPTSDPSPRLPREEAGAKGAATRAQSTEAVLAQLKELCQQRATSGPIAVRELRQAHWPALPDKVAIDAALLELARQDRVILFRHDYPAGLTPEERELLVADRAGNFFNAVALKESSGSGT